MPAWVILFVAIVGALTAAVFVGKLLLAVVRAAAALDRALPVMRDMTDAFHGDPNVFKVLQQIAAQFRTDSGSTLRDVVNRLEVTAKINEAAIKALAVDVGDREMSSAIHAEAARILAADDRGQIARLVIALEGVHTKQDAAAEAAVAVAEDLEAGHQRAEAVDSGASGDAADAAATRPTED